MKYVGARYVPKFMGVYDATINYEALSVVDNGMGTTYISNQPTPAGTPLTDTTYWIVYGSSSGAIINLQNQIDAINVEIANDVILISDSFGTVQNTYNQTMLDIAELLTPRTVIKSAVAGASFSGTPNFLAQLQAIPDSNNVSDIYVFGGPNDVTANTQADIEQGIHDFVSYAQAHFPNALLHIGYEGIHWTISSYITAAHNMVIPAYKAILNYGGDFVKDFISIMHDPALTYDGLHPTSDAVNKMGRQIGRLLNGLPVDSSIANSYSASDCTVTAPFTSVDYVYVAEKIENGRARLGSNQGGTIQVTANPAINITTFTPLFTTDASTIYPTDNALKCIAVPITAKVLHSDSTVTSELMYLYKNGKSFNVSPAAGAINDVVRLVILIPQIEFNTIEV